MSRSLASVICYRVARTTTRLLATTNTGSRSISSVSQLKIDPSKLIAGLTREKLESDPEILSFLQSNFPHAFENGSNNTQHNTDDSISPSLSVDGTTITSKMKKDEDVEIIYERNIRPLTTYLRDPETEEGRRMNYRMRKFEQLIPGLLYGGNPNLGIYSFQPESKIYIKTPNRFLQREIDRFGNDFESRVYNLTVLADPDDTEGIIHRVTPANLQKHPVRDTMYYCCNFVRYHPGRPLKIPITYANEEESSALKRDGFIVPINRFVECFVEDNVDIPEKIELECTGLQYKDVLRKDRLLIPDGVRLSDRVIKKGDQFIIGVVFGKSRGAIAKEEQEAAAAGSKKK